jgi:hypothetical protein
MQASHQNQHSPLPTSHSKVGGRAELFRSKARDLRALADSAANLKTREGYTALAGVWDSFAKRLESSTPISDSGEKTQSDRL